MSRDQQSSLEKQLHASEERFRLAQSAGGIGTFVLDLASNEWEWTRQVAELFGFGSHAPGTIFREWERAIFADDVPKVRAALEAAARTGTYYVEFRVKHPDGSVHWLAGKGESADKRALAGAYYEITDRKALEARLLALNETLEARVAELREEARVLEILNETGATVAAELDIERLVQSVTDAGVELSGAEFGAFFYNVLRESGEAYTLYTLSGAPREAFAKFPMPRNTQVFEPTFRGHGTVRVDDILTDPRYGHNPPYHGMPPGDLPVRSYLAVPVVSRSGDVLGGLFFGHPDPGVFTQRAERIVTGIAGQAALAIDNARLYQTSQREVEARKRTEQELQRLNENLEQRISERVEQLAASNARLRQTEHRFRLLLDAVTDYAIFMLDTEGKVASWNPGAERIKGYLAEEIIGHHFSRFYTEEDRQSGVPERALAIALRDGHYEMEGWRVRKDGSTFWGNIVIHAIRDSSGQPAGFAKITRDLTEKRASEERQRQAQKMEAIGQLTGGVAHDFNNLLQVILGNLDAVRRGAAHGGPLRPDAVNRLIGNAIRGAERAATLTQRLLAFGRRQPLDPKPTDVNKLVAGMSDLLLRRTLDETVKIETVLAGGLWRVAADTNQLESALLNLAVNARDAMPEGGKLTIETANTHLDEAYAAAHGDIEAGQYVMIAVTDTGLGMTKEVVAKAFDPFFTTKDIGRGSGLGLSQVYGFVKQSGGHVKIYSELGEGTTVKLYLPRLLSGEAQASNMVEAPGVPTGTESELILLVEDDEDVRANTAEMIRELGYGVLTAPDGPTALRVLQHHPEVKLLFTDVGLPNGLNGRQLADEACQRHSGLRVLFTSGYARNAIVHHGRLDPGVELIAKPFTYAALAVKIRRILEG